MLEDVMTGDNHTKAYVNTEICKEHYLDKRKFGLNEKEII